MNLGDRMKLYEGQMAGDRCMPLLPICARLDGKAFHAWTRDLDRPYDRRLIDLMIATTRFLVEHTCATVGYTQSDEITLIWRNDSIESQVYFDGKVHKLVSVLASMATAFFNREVPRAFTERTEAGLCTLGLDGVPERPLALFDCRVWQVPSLDEAANVLVWRELDATRNSVQMAAQAKFSYEQLLNKCNADMQEMLFKVHGINWNDYPAYFKRGTYVHRVLRQRLLTTEEREKIPEVHRPPEGTTVDRPDVVELPLPKITSIENKAGVLFLGEEIQLKSVEG